MRKELISETDGWRLYIRHRTTNLLNLKLESTIPNIPKRCWRITCDYHGRLVGGHIDLPLLARIYPKTHRWVADTMWRVAREGAYAFPAGWRLQAIATLVRAAREAVGDLGLSDKAKAPMSLAQYLSGAGQAIAAIFSPGGSATGPLRPAIRVSIKNCQLLQLVR
jgi:hypothetical protein